jgi:DNA-binding XRE family transcriptional regulator
VEKSIYSAEYQRLCSLLRELRHEACLTQVQVAARLGVPQSFVSKYESGERRLVTSSSSRPRLSPGPSAVICARRVRQREADPNS